MKDSINSVEDTMLIRFLMNDTSENENEAIYNYLNESEKNFSYFINLKKAWEANQEESFKNRSFGDDLKIINKRLSFSSSDKKTRKWNMHFVRIAASVLILLGISAVFYFTRTSNGELAYHELITPKGDMTKIVLSDGSKVWLASDTKFKFPERFESNERRVYLDGMAYFDVSHKKGKAFIVDTKEYDIKVLGTTFNVKAFSDENLTETSLIEGKVEIVFDEKRNEKLKDITLKPGQKLIFNKDADRIIHAKYNQELDVSWIEGRLTFKDESFIEIARKIERFYDVTIIFENKEIENIRYTGDFDEETIKEALDVIRIITPFEYTKRERVITIEEALD